MRRSPSTGRSDPPVPRAADPPFHDPSHEARMSHRHDGRAPHEFRPVQIQRRYLRTCPGSVLYRCGGTSILVTAQIADEVPPFLEGKETGWLTAEYAMLPGSTPSRKKRGPDGRATEISR